MLGLNDHLHQLVQMVNNINTTMEKEAIQSLLNDFESIVQNTSEGIEFWYARDLQHLLGYSRYDKFKPIILKAKTACDTTGDQIEDHFLDAERSVVIGSGAKRTIDDIMLTRYACYLIAQNGDSKKEQVSFAQSYFAVKARKAELIEQRIQDLKRLNEREKLKYRETQLSDIIHAKGGNFGLVRSLGDKALFSNTTQEMKDKLGVPKNRPLADFLQSVLVRGKDFATEITVFNAKDKQLNSIPEITDEHITNNSMVRELLLKRGIVPENLPPAEDVQKLERRVKREQKQSFKDKDKLI